MGNSPRTTRRRKRASAIAQRRLPLAMPPAAHATIDISLAVRADQPRAGENPLMCAACGELRPFGGAAIVKIVPLSDEAKQGMQEREEMVPLCAECLHSPTASNAVVRHFYPDLKIFEGGEVSMQ